MISPRRRFRYWWNGTPTGRAVEVLAACLFVSVGVVALAAFATRLLI